MASIAFPSLAKKVDLSDGTTYGYVRVQASAGKPTLLFLHGYPSSSYDWHHQIKYFSEKGYGLVVPDLLGYGDSSKPVEIEAYGMKKIIRQILDVLDHEKLDKVVAIGHDWGCGPLSSLARWSPERFHAFVFAAVCYQPSALRDIDTINEQTQELLGYPIFGYWTFHKQQDAHKVIEANMNSYNSIVYPSDKEIWKSVLCPIGEIRKFTEEGKIAPRPSWWSAEEEEMHNQILGIDGYQGPLNWYKQAMAGVSASEEFELSDAQRVVSGPVLFIRAEKDYVCIPDLMLEGVDKYVKNLKVASIDACHWLQLEKPDEFNDIVDGFIVELRI